MLGAAGERCLPVFSRLDTAAAGWWSSTVDEVLCLRAMERRKRCLHSTLFSECRVDRAIDFPLLAYRRCMVQSERGDGRIAIRQRVTKRLPQELGS